MVCVLHIVSGLKIGGTEMVLYRLITDVSNDAYRHVVISLSPEGGMEQLFHEAGIELFVLNFKSSPFLQFARLISLINSVSPDIVQTWMYHADLVGGLAARVTARKNIIWGVRNTDLNFGGSRVTVWVRWLCARLSSVVPNSIVCAAQASRRTHEALGYSPERMVVVPNGFDLARLQATKLQVQALRLASGLVATDVVIGTLGRFDAAKDPQNFVLAAGLLGRQFPQVKFLMVGRNCDKANTQLMGWIEAKGLASRFVLLGERRDAPVCLAAMDVFCLSSRTEGFPNVVGEAMAMRRACVVTDVGDAAYLLGGCGFVVPKEDSAALALGMGKLLGLSTAERAEFGERAHARITSEFTIGRTRERFEAIYARVLAGLHPQQ